VYPFFVSKTGLSLRDLKAVPGYLVKVSTGFEKMKFYRQKRPFWIGETPVDNFRGDAIQKRFEFGRNWQLFLSVLNEERILEADKSLKQMLEIGYLKGRSFLDIGSGSGMFSLVANDQRQQSVPSITIFYRSLGVKNPCKGNRVQRVHIFVKGRSAKATRSNDLTIV